ncbi:MAG: F-box protein [Nitrosopumilus sp.]|nr:F-box protein [Nitrosopumilus sp.]
MESSSIIAAQNFPTYPFLNRPFGYIKQSTVLPQELILYIFAHIKDIHCLDTIHKLSTVCVEWASITQNSDFWKYIFFKSGVSLPLNQKTNLHHAYAYQKGDLLVNTLRACKTPSVETIKTNINFSKYSNVHFVEDSHVIAYDKDTIVISPLKSGAKINEITFPSKILSICSSQNTIFCGLANGQIMSASLNQEKEISLIVNEKNSFSGDFDESEFNVFANDKWIVGATDDVIKKMNRESNEFTTINFNYVKEDIQLHFNTLYWTSTNNDGDRGLYSLNLDDGIAPIFIRELESDVSNLRIFGNKGAYTCEMFDNYDISNNTSSEFDEESSDEDRAGKPGIISFTLNEEIDHVHTPKTFGSDIKPQFLFFGDIMIIARDNYDAEESYNVDESSESDESSETEILKNNQEAIEIIDLKSKKSLPLTQKNSIHVSKNRFNQDIWPIGVYQNTIHYVAKNNEIVKVSFMRPMQNQKRKRNYSKI